ncbi:MAG: hypothetical protein COA45_05960 [Zetaproteobacteria bacterium]|nr:MAG: hypothetical protein COA45_05960 [Zetaproteobacteria bacterium]
MFTYFKDLSISAKITSFMVTNFALMAVVLLMTMNILAKEGEKISEIAHQDIPLTEAISQITVHQLEQAINFERAMRYGEELAHNAAAKQNFEKAVHHFQKLSHLVDEELASTEKLVDIFIHEAHSQEAKEEFVHVLAVLKQIEIEHASFEKHAEEVFKLIEHGKLTKAEHLAEAIEIEEDKLNHELEALQLEIEKFTEKAAIEAEHLEQQAMSIMVVGLILSIMMVVFLVWLTRKMVTSPLKNAIRVLVKLSDGDTSVSLSVDTKDEIGDLSNVIEDFRKKTIQLEKAAGIEAMAQEEREARSKKVNTLVSGFEQVIASVTSSVASTATQLHTTAESMGSAVGDATNQANNITISSNETSGNVQTVAAAVEELDVSIREISQQIQSVASSSNDVSDKAKSANKTAEELQGASTKIGEIVSLIQDIAEQTNLLALNATIEAARAGDAGKGFAVVANEVKSLAGQTASATAEISEQINNIQHISNSVVDVFVDINSAVSGLSSAANGIAAAVEEQSAATQDIANNMQKAAQGTDAIRNSIGEVSDAIVVANDGSKEVIEASNTLSSQADNMKTEVDKFLTDIAAV